MTLSKAADIIASHTAGYTTTYENGRVKRADNGGIYCRGCDWEQGPDGVYRPWAAFWEHVAAVVRESEPYDLRMAKAEGWSAAHSLLCEKYTHRYLQCENPYLLDNES